MKKWFYIVMLSLMIVFGIIGCTSEDDETQGGKQDDATPIHITIPKRRRGDFTAEIDTVSVTDENGEILFACDTKGEITIKLNDSVLTVVVPERNDSCFDNGKLAE